MLEKLGILKKTRELDSKVNEFLSNIAEAGLVFQKALAVYLSDDKFQLFEDYAKEVSAYENRNDHLRRVVQARIYTDTLIPESRADVLFLMEEMDNILNMVELLLLQISIERPQIKGILVDLFGELAEATVNAIEAIVRSSRAFFINLYDVNQHIHKVMFYEKQADQACLRIKRAIFADDALHLSQKLQIQTFCNEIEAISNKAEDVADQLSIFTIKRMV